MTLEVMQSVQDPDVLARVAKSRGARKHQVSMGGMVVAGWIFRTAVATLVACAFSQAISAETLKPPPGTFVNADWKRKPSLQELMAVFPSEAFKRGISGKATISCNITPQGALNACTVVDESPAGKGFGSAAIALTPQFMMRPATLNGVPVASQARIPITFTVPEGGMESVGSKRVLPPNLPWIEAPSYTDVSAAYPRKAREAGIGGRATVSCAMGEDGRLKDCSTGISEPRGYGFDTAAKSLARQFRIAVTNDEGRKATHKVAVHLPVTFDPGMLGGGEPVIGKPSWAALPTNDQMNAAFASLMLKGTTRATIACTVEQGGSLKGCSVVSEQPLGAGVGAAALALTPAFRMTTWTAEGLPTVGGLINIPIRYEPARGDTPPPPAPK